MALIIKNYRSLCFPDVHSSMLHIFGQFASLDTIYLPVLFHAFRLLDQAGKAFHCELGLSAC